MGKKRLGTGNRTSYAKTGAPKRNNKEAPVMRMPTQIDGEPIIKKGRNNPDRDNNGVHDLLTMFQMDYNNNNDNNNDDDESSHQNEDDNDRYSSSSHYFYDDEDEVEGDHNDVDNNDFDIHGHALIPPVVDDVLNKAVMDTIEEYINECRNKSAVADFNIMTYVDEGLAKLRYFAYPEDADEPINDTSGLTKKQFAQSIQKVYDMNGVDLSCRKDLDNLIYNAFAENSNLPYRSSRKRKADGKINGIPIYDKYSLPKSDILSFDVCVNGCMVYVGVNAKHDTCSVCKEERCHRKENLKRNANNNNMEEGKAKCQINYRCFIPVVTRLLHYPNFIEALNFHNEDICDDYLTDVTDGTNVSSAIIDMKEVYANYVSNLNDGEVAPIHIGLVLSFNWDGMQQFKTKSSVFWPTFLSIENLPPTFRKAIGAGTFLSSIFTKTQDSIIEDFVFSNCLIPELEALMEGKLVEVKGQKYLLQAR